MINNEIRYKTRNMIQPMKIEKTKKLKKRKPNN